MRYRIPGSIGLTATPNEARARVAFTELKGQWTRDYLSAVGIIERDLDSLLRFYRFEQKYWPSLRTTNPIERLNKEFKRRTKAAESIGTTPCVNAWFSWIASRPFQ